MHSDRVPRPHRILSLICLLLLSGAAVAEAPYFEFTRALRDRGHHDTALEYLQMLETQDVPADVKERLPFEQAVIRIDLARLERTPRAKNTHLNSAMTSLQEFLKSIPDDHPLAGQANGELAAILMGKAKVAVLQSQDPTNVSEKLNFQNEARDLIGQARDIVKKARDQYQAAFEKFPVFVPKTDRERWEARKAIEDDLLRAKLDYATTFYEEANTWEKSDPIFKKKMDEAVAEFEKLHTRHRLEPIGLYAHAWMGKCFEEQDEVGKALGIYNQLLSHKGTSETMTRLKDDVQHFRLVCLNHPKRRDYVLALQESTEWLKQRRSRANTRTGLGIRWEKARAAELLGQSNALPNGVMDFVEMSYQLAGVDETIPRGEQEDFYEQAITEAELLARIPSLYSQPAQEMIRRLEGVLNRTGGDPQDFNTADSLSAGNLRKVQRTRKKLKIEKDPKAQQELFTELTESINRGLHLSRVGIRLADGSVPTLLVQDLRRRAAYFLFLKQDYYEAATIAGFIARTTPPEHSISLDSAYLEMGAWVRAFNKAGEDRDFELNRLIAACELITSTWPDSETAIDARMQLGDLYRNLNQPNEAADWFLQISETSPRYPEAQLKAGQAYLATYHELSIERNADKQQLMEWEQKAREHLEKGIKLMTEQITLTANPPDLLTGARLSLVQILVRHGEYEPALDLLTKTNHAIIDAVSMQPEPGKFDFNLEAKRPATGVKSRLLAGLAHQMLLRCYIGTKQIEEARGAMADLEAVVGLNDTETLFAAYEELGRELQNEITRLKELDQTEDLEDLRTSFDLFLGELYKGRAKAKFNTLIWIGQTYQSLGDGVTASENPSQADLDQASPYYAKAIDTYEQILSRAEGNPEFMQPQYRPTVQLLKVRCHRKAQQFEEGYKAVFSMLTDNPNRRDAQEEAAMLLQAWGNSGIPNGAEKLREAVGKRLSAKSEQTIWGWLGLASKYDLFRARDLRSGNYDIEAHAVREEARLTAYLRLYETLHQLGQISSRAEREGPLVQAHTGIQGFVNLYGPMPQEWYEKFNTLFAEVSKELGEPIEDLPRIKKEDAIFVPPEQTDPGKEVVAEVDEQPEELAAPEEPSSPVWMILAVVIALGVGIGCFIMMNNSGKNRRRGGSRSRGGSGKKAPAAAKAKRSER